VEEYEDFEVEGDEPRGRGEEVASVGQHCGARRVRLGLFLGLLNSFPGLSIALFLGKLVWCAKFSVHEAPDGPAALPRTSFEYFVYSTVSGIREGTMRLGAYRCILGIGWHCIYSM
jgi:hypothetical protein